MKHPKLTQLLAAAFCLLLLQPAFAQSKRKARDSSVTIIFSEEKAPSATAKKKKKAAGDANIVKIVPLGFISGQFPILYERRLADMLTIQVGGGLTHRNYIRNAFGRINDDEQGNLVKTYPWTTNDYDVAEPLYSFEARQPKIGYMFRIEPRFYFEGEAPEDNYLALQYNSARYNFTIPRYVNGAHTGAPQDEYETLNDFMVHFGHQTLHDHLTTEWSTALGLRQIKGRKYVANGMGADGFSDYTKSTINFAISFTLGYRF